MNSYQGAGCCISYYSYIKPQRWHSMNTKRPVVYLTIPTSNHNRNWFRSCQFRVVYLTIPTSNHNVCCWVAVCGWLYILLFLHQTTTNICTKRVFAKLYILLFLHQTTTLRDSASSSSCCISYYSYIKPQLTDELCIKSHGCISYYSYIKPQRTHLQ